MKERVEEPARVRGFRRRAAKQRTRQRETDGRDEERDNETDGLINYDSGIEKLGFVVSTELIKCCELRD